MFVWQTFHRFGGINVTGKLDKQTVDLMGTPRCGVPDVLEEQLVDDQEILDVGDKEEEENGTTSYFPSRRKRYALQGSRWRTKSLTYKVKNQMLHGCNKKGATLYKVVFQPWKLTRLKSRA